MFKRMDCSETRTIFHCQAFTLLTAAVVKADNTVMVLLYKMHPTWFDLELAPLSNICSSPRWTPMCSVCIHLGEHKALVTSSIPAGYTQTCWGRLKHWKLHHKLGKPVFPYLFTMFPNTKKRRKTPQNQREKRGKKSCRQFLNQDIT